MANDNNEYLGTSIALIKFFTKEEHYLAFKNGSSLFRPPHFFRTNDDPGRGDRTESCLGYWDKTLGDQFPIFLDPEGKPLDLPYDLEAAEKILIHPTNEVHDSWIQCWTYIESHNCFEDSLEKMLDEFGPYFVILPIHNIKAYAELLSTISKSSVSGCLVDYSDDPLKRSLTVKDSCFSHQKEYRFFVGQCSKEEISEKFLSLPGLGDLLLKDANTLKVTAPSGGIRYCTQGRKEVITVEADSSLSERHSN